MEHDDGGRDKKLIWAIEAHHRHGRPSCSECSDALREKRACRKPGVETKGQAVFVSSSPFIATKGAPARIYECPVGMVLREAPQAYDAIAAYGSGEQIGPSMLREPLWLQHAFRVIGSERARHHSMDDADRRAANDAKFGARVRAGHG